MLRSQINLLPTHLIGPKLFSVGRAAVYIVSTVSQNIVKLEFSYVYLHEALYEEHLALKLIIAINIQTYMHTCKCCAFPSNKFVIYFIFIGKRRANLSMAVRISKKYKQNMPLTF